MAQPALELLDLRPLRVEEHPRAAHRLHVGVEHPAGDAPDPGVESFGVFVGAHHEGRVEGRVIVAGDSDGRLWLGEQPPGQAAAQRQHHQ